jgi:hypothetical protein
VTTTDDVLGLTPSWLAGPTVTVTATAPADGGTLGVPVRPSGPPPTGLGLS